MVKFSVIIPAYNCEKYICRCIESVLNQQYSNFEILIIDDGSKDNTYKLCTQYVQKDYKVKYFHKENSGVSSARNFGIEKATGEYILFLDADDYLLKDALNCLDKVIERTKCELIKFRHASELKKYYNKIEIKTKANQIIYKKDYEKIIYQNIFSSDYSNVWDCAFKKENIKNITFDENIKFGEDNLFMVENLLESKNIYYLDQVLYVYYLNNGSTTNKMDFEKTKKRVTDIIMVDKRIFEKVVEQAKFSAKDIFNAYKKRINQDMYYLIADNIKRYSYSEYKTIIKYIKEECLKEDIPIDINSDFNYIRIHIKKSIKNFIKGFATYFKIKWNSRIVFK